MQGHYAHIPKTWSDKTAVCIASGTSLTDNDVAYVYNMRRLDKCRVIVVNNNYLKAPWADHLHACDKQFFKWHMHNPTFKTLNMPITTLTTELEQDMIDRGVKILRSAQKDGLFLHGDQTIATGANSGYQAINVAFLYGAEKVLLLGYDCKSAPDGKTHWFGSHPSPTSPEVYDEYLKHWQSLPAALNENKLEVINCTRDTAIDCLPRGDIMEVLQ